ncbi:tRNA (cytidine(34)-2'-O)-methyltransferase [Clostridiaceae bacterium JG1575]|nr:tRNA (cytidine(34)-2'-O)-methyltransferase [Clostridiaceae bacterium JG1575]
MLNIVLFEPEIPQNTGNIGRTCVLTGSRLHLVGPLGFELSDKQIRRCGLDYWKDVDLRVYENWDAFLKEHPGARLYGVSTKGDQRYDAVNYEEGDFLVFGKESQGLPQYVRDHLSKGAIRVPMVKTSTRSLNLSNTVAILVYEVLRQWDFPAMK